MQNKSLRDLALSCSNILSAPSARHKAALENLTKANARLRWLHSASAAEVEAEATKYHRDALSDLRELRYRHAVEIEECEQAQAEIYKRFSQFPEELRDIASNMLWALSDREERLREWGYHTPTKLTGREWRAKQIALWESLSRAYQDDWQRAKERDQQARAIRETIDRFFPAPKPVFVGTGERAHD